MCLIVSADLGRICVLIESVSRLVVLFAHNASSIAQTRFGIEEKKDKDRLVTDLHSSASLLRRY
jgi:uncharacterized membrane protein